MAILFISKKNTRCGHCGLRAYAFSTVHNVVPDTNYALATGQTFSDGCGADFTKVSSYEKHKCYREWAAEHRPDLKWVDV